MKKIMAMAAAIVMMLLTLCSCAQTDSNIENYDRDVSNYQATAFMPDLNEIGEYQDIDYLLRKDELIFPDYALRLIVKYEKDAFLKEKERLKSAYTYLDAPQTADFDNSVYAIPVEEFSAAGFEFKITVFDDTDYPKNFGMVGVSDQKCEIAYLWVYSPDLDCICKVGEDQETQMREFVEYHFSLDQGMR